MPTPVNRLAREKSPYLLQHASNPVDWYPWGEEAFREARRLDRPIFLSVGYSTCHWCHVMERESFEDAEVAHLMNDVFIPVKVDREERPDLDHYYMTLCQALTGSGGWPLTVIMTPEKEPFYAGTYLPRESRFGRIGMVELVPKIAAVWNSQREEVLKAAGRIAASLKEQLDAGRSAGGALPGEETFDRARDQIAPHFDERYGGFGKAPKFPHPAYLRFLLRRWKRSDDEEALGMVVRSLNAMAAGGVWDHIGGGFHRYATDERWLLPHFEKMLYDQALLSMACVEAWQATGDPALRRTAEEIFAYVLRDMRAAGGGFCSAEDADSEGEEGKFYLWKMGEVRSLLGEEESAAAAEAWNLNDGGNFVDEMGEPSANNIPHRRAPSPEAAAGDGERDDLLRSARAKLFAARERRPRPLRDDKVLADWNGLMIAALAKGAAAFGDDRLAAAAGEAADFILTGMRDGEGRLLHRYREGEAAIPALLDDYAFFAWGLIELYGATFRPARLREAVELTEQMLSLFADKDGEGLFLTSREGSDLPVRQRVCEDGSLPAGSSVAAENLLRLSHLTGEERYEKEAAAIISSCALLLREHPAAVSHLLGALDFALGPAVDVVIAAAGSSDNEAAAMVDTLRHAFLPNVTIHLVRPDIAGEITALAPFLSGYTAVDGMATAYVCRGNSCSAPERDLKAFRALVDGSGSPTVED